MRTVKHITRSNLPKPKTFKIRNYRPAEQVAAELSTQRQKLNKKQNVVAERILEREPEQDMFDYTHEEEGYIISNGNKINIKFPR